MEEVIGDQAAAYDGLAWFYDRYWSAHYHRWAEAILNRTLLSNLPVGSRILDVCCGNGILARELSDQGYRVLGLDISREMIACAVRNAPAAEFLCADARSFGFREEFDGALSTFDSLNHILSAQDLSCVFENVRKSLKPDSQFIFDVNLEGAYRIGWKDTCTSVDTEHACFIRGRYDSTTRIAQTFITIFRDMGEWKRTDLTLTQCYYPSEQILDLLRRAGFHDAHCYDADRDLGVSGPFGDGRGIIVARAGARRLQALIPVSTTDTPAVFAAPCESGSLTPPVLDY